MRLAQAHYFADFEPRGLGRGQSGFRRSVVPEGLRAGRIGPGTHAGMPIP